MTESGFAEVNGAQLYYEITGQGQPLVMVHAGICDSRMWDDQLAAFAQRYQVIRYDMRGYGKSPMVETPYTSYGDLYSLLKFLGVEAAYLVGCSKGGMAILDLALEHPEMTKALVLVGSGLGGYEYTGDEPPQWKDMVAADERGDLDAVNELEVQVWVDGWRTPHRADPAVRERVREMNRIALATDDVKNKIEQRLDPPAAQRLNELRLPILAIVGDLDDPNMMAIADLLVERVPGTKKAVMSGTAHVPNMERPDEFSRLALDFLGSL